MIRLAFGVICQHFDDAALGDASVTAAVDHTAEFRLQRGQGADALVDVRKSRTRDRVGGAA